MSATLQRHLAMLSLIPAYPHTVTASQLHARLAAQGFEVHSRSIERDLQKLSNFGLVSDEGKPARWSWQPGAKGVSLPPMSTENALLLELVRRNLATNLPPRLLEALAQPFEEARQTLKLLSDTPVGRWAERVAVLPEGAPLMPPQVAPGVFATVCDALLQDRRLEAHYRALSWPRARRCIFDPLGLVHRDGVIYLAALFDGYDDVRNLALQRFSQARVLDAPARRPEDFDLERYVHALRGFEWPHGRQVRLELRIRDEWLRTHLDERHLAPDQRITPLRGEADVFRVTATVAATEQFYWWLRSLGTSVEVIKPLGLRRRLGAEAAELARRYASTA
ncbi:helix-turn-helix transcriptional regulator [Dokdonella sp.]|uniref:helix-turn-helix transcriptional regulator n=1 Tax=Dokdonella sp. TaxID=2291710 RepID=UPI0031C43961|nr:WYL domain-containing protein [Dokdonella sp.]